MMARTENRVPPTRRWLLPAAVFICYAALWISLDLLASGFETEPGVHLWYPPVGLSYALLLVFGLRYWPAVLAVNLAESVYNEHVFAPLEFALYDLPTVGIGILTVWFLLNVVRMRPDLDDGRDVIWYVLIACMLDAFVTSLIQVSAEVLTGQLAPGELLLNVLSHWSGDATGTGMGAVVLVTLRAFPSLWAIPPRTSGVGLGPVSRAELPELVAQAAVLIACVVFAFGLVSEDQIQYTYFIFLPVIWVAFRNGFPRAAVALLAVNFLAAGLAASELGEANIFALQFGLMTLTLSGLILGSQVTSQRRLTDELLYRANHDYLTGLANRAAFTRRLEKTVSDPSEGYALIQLDLTRFKSINDSLGREAGDRALTSAARRLQTSVGPRDMAARLEGDEFVVLLGGVGGARRASEITTDLQSELAQPHDIGGRAVRLGSSAGVFAGPDHAGTAEEALRNADTALRHAKASGEDHAVFDETMYHRTRRRIEMEAGLRRAVEEEEVTLRYQPIVDLQSGAVVGVEALARWTWDGSPVPPPEFISLAEETGLIHRLGGQILREACSRAEGWREGGMPLQVSVNVSVAQARDPDFAGVVLDTLRQTRLPPDWLQLELTESIWMDPEDHAVQRLRDLAAEDVRLAIDDFGTGYSSLSYLSGLPVKTLKLDRSFVNAMGTPANDGLVEAVLAMSSGLGLKVVAEGVEREEELSALRELGCEMCQGFLISSPMPPEELTPFVRDWKRRA